MMIYRRQIRMDKDLRNIAGKSRSSQTFGVKKSRKVPTSLSNMIDIDIFKNKMKKRKFRYTSHLCIFLPSLLLSVASSKIIGPTRLTVFSNNVAQVFLISRRWVRA